MIFESDGSIDGKLTYGYEAGWHHSKGKGSYHTGEDFFWVHWEIGDRVPNTIKLHVESPKYAVDPELNTLKQWLVEALLDWRIKEIIENRGFDYRPGRRTKLAHIQNFKCTSPFKIVLRPDQIQGTPQANITLIQQHFGQQIHSAFSAISTPVKSRFLVID